MKAPGCVISRYIDEYARFWYVGHDGGLQPHLHQYSNWGTWALYHRYLVNQDKAFLTNSAGRVHR